MSRHTSYLQRLWRKVGGLLRPTQALAVSSPVARVLQHQQRLFQCAVQLLDDGAAAQQVVLDALTQVLRSEQQDPQTSLAASPTAEPGPVSTGTLTDQALSDRLDRLVVNLALIRLKALSAAVRQGGSDEAWPIHRDELPPGSGEAAALPVETAQSASNAGLQLQRISQVLSLLSPEPRVTVMLVVMQGRSLSQVAALLGCSEVTCRFWLSHGRKTLRRALQRDLFEDDLGTRESRLVLAPGALNELRGSKKATARA